MHNNEAIIDEASIREYVAGYDIFPNLQEIVQQALDQNPDIHPIALSPINIERTVDNLKTRGISTIGALDKILNDHQAEILLIMNRQEGAFIAARHVYTPIYILLENIPGQF